MVVIANNARAKIYESGEVKSEIIVLHVASVTNNYANFSPSENYTGRKIRFSFFFFVFFFCVLQRNTHRGEAQRRRGRGEDSRRNPITFNAFAMCFEMKGDPKKNCNFSNGRSWRQKIESCLRACLSRVIIMFFLVWSNLYRVFHYREHTRNADFPESCSPVFAWKSNVHVSFFRFFLLLRALLDKSQKEFLSLHFRLCFSNLMPRGVTRLFP